MRWFWLGLGPGASVILVVLFNGGSVWAGSPKSAIPLARNAGVGEMEGRIQTVTLTLSERWYRSAQGDCLSPDLLEWKSKHWATERGLQSVALVARMAQARAQEKRLEDLIASGAHWRGMESSTRLAQERGREMATRIILQMVSAVPADWRFLTSECGAQETPIAAPSGGCRDPLQLTGIEALVAFNESVSRGCRPLPAELRAPQSGLQEALDKNRDEYIRMANGGLHEVFGFSANVSEGLALNYAMMEVELFKKRMLERQKDVLDQFPICSPYGR